MGIGQADVQHRLVGEVVADAVIRVVCSRAVEGHVRVVAVHFVGAGVIQPEVQVEAFVLAETIAHVAREAGRLPGEFRLRVVPAAVQQFAHGFRALAVRSERGGIRVALSPGFVLRPAVAELGVDIPADLFPVSVDVETSLCGLVPVDAGEFVLFYLAVVLQVGLVGNQSPVSCFSVFIVDDAAHVGFVPEV